MKTFQVGEVARRLGMNAQTIYFYEKIGLIPHLQRTEAGYRLFVEADIDRLYFIVRAKTLGLSLDEIKDILTLKDQQSLTCQAVYERITEKVTALQAQINQLQTLHDDLQLLLEQCAINRHQTDRQCTVLDP